MNFDPKDLTQNDFLGGRLTLAQPRDGYRAGVDPILLAAATSARAGHSVLDLGCGAGAAMFALGRRVEGLDLWGLEVQPQYANLARENAKANALPATIVSGDVGDVPADLKSRSFDHVICNPPYFDRATGIAAQDPGRDTALGGNAPMDIWIGTAARRLKPKGYLTLIQRIERLPEVLSALETRLGSVRILPISARLGRNPQLFLCQARKEGRAPFQLLPPLVLHRGDTHERDEDDYRPEISAILRDGAALSWPN